LIEPKNISHAGAQLSSEPQIRCAFSVERCAFLVQACRRACSNSIPTCPFADLPKNPALRTSHPATIFSSAVAKPSIEPKRISCAFVSPLPVLPQIHSYLLSATKGGKVKGRKG